MTSTLTPDRSARLQAAIEGACAAATGPAFLEDVAGHLREAVPHRASWWSAVDPVMGLATSPSLVQDISPLTCAPFWEAEFLQEDFLSFSDLLRAPRGVATLHDATAGRLRRSQRYTAINRIDGFGDELRAVARTGSACWGLVLLYRGDDEPPFSAAEQTFVASVEAAIAAAFRRVALAGHRAGAGGDAAPGVLLFDAENHLTAATPTVGRWLEELPAVAPVRMELGIAVPTEVFAVVLHARAVAAGLATGAARARIRGRSGQWVAVHASVLADPTRPGAEQIAVVIEPANPSEVAPIVQQAFGLTAREQEVVACLARGLDTGQIAATLFLSAHTVRDHLKAVFEKVGVSSRGELVARVFWVANEAGAHSA